MSAQEEKALLVRTRWNREDKKLVIEWTSDLRNGTDRRRGSNITMARKGSNRLPHLPLVPHASNLREVLDLQSPDLRDNFIMHLRYLEI